MRWIIKMESMEKVRKGKLTNNLIYDRDGVISS